MKYNQKLSRFTFLVPIFNLKGYRLDNFKYVLTKMAETTNKIIVVEQLTGAPETEAKKFTKQLGVNYVGVPISDTHIHKSRLINIGTQYVKTEFVWVNDSDCYIKFKDAINAIDFRYNFIQPFKIGKYLNEEESNKIRSNEPVNITFNYSKLHETEQFTVPGSLYYVSMYGALSFIFKKESFEEINGMNESYRGWGLEDNSLCARMFNYKDLRFNIIDIHAIHLYHPRGNFEDKIADEITQANIKIYEEEFGDEYTKLHEKLREYYDDHAEKTRKVSIIGIERSGTNHLQSGIANGEGLIGHGEPFNNSYFNTKDETNINPYRYPYIDMATDSQSSLEKYIDTTYYNQNIIVKHIYGSNSAPLNYYDLTSTEYLNICKERIIDHSTELIITTRSNFLDWLTSFALAMDQNMWMGYKGDYEKGKTKLTQRQVNNLYTKWEKYHCETVPQIISQCEESNTKYIVIDYDEINDPTSLKKRLKEINITKFNSRVKKQKKGENSDYIVNYDEAVKWYWERSGVKPTPFYIITRFSVKYRDYDNFKNEDWLKLRLRLFEHCFESFKNQSHKDFKWIVLANPNTLGFAMDRLYQMQEEFPQMVVLKDIEFRVYSQDTKTLRNYITNDVKERGAAEFITMWHDSDDILIDSDAISDFATQLESKPEDTIARSSNIKKGTINTFTDGKLDTDCITSWKSPGFITTCIALKSSLEKYRTIYNYHHNKWGEVEDVKVMDLRPEKFRHYKIANDGAICNKVGKDALVPN